MKDWADSEDHDYLNEWVGHTISDVTTGESADKVWIRLHLRGGRVVEVVAEVEKGQPWLTVQDYE